MSLDTEGFSEEEGGGERGLGKNCVTCNMPRSNLAEGDANENQIYKIAWCYWLSWKE